MPSKLHLSPLAPTFSSDSYDENCRLGNTDDNVLWLRHEKNFLSEKAIPSLLWAPTLYWKYSTIGISCFSYKILRRMDLCPVFFGRLDSGGLIRANIDSALNLMCLKCPHSNLRTYGWIWREAKSIFVCWITCQILDRVFFFLDPAGETTCHCQDSEIFVALTLRI